MIQLVKITNYLGESELVELARPEKSGFAITDITGLGPEKCNLNITDTAYKHGGKFNSWKKGTRNIVLTIKYLWAPTIEDSRHRVYTLFHLGKKVRLEFITDSKSCYIDGYVESNEVPIFSNDQGSQISVLCEDPWFKNVSYLDINGLEYNDEFEFPFSNESLTENLIEFGTVRSNNSIQFYYPGEVDTGFVMKILFNEVSDILYKEYLGIRANNVDGEFFEIYLSEYDDRIHKEDLIVSKGDTLVISTVPGDKYVKLLKKYAEYGKGVVNLLYKVTKMDWIGVRPGNNFIELSSSSRPHTKEDWNVQGMPGLEISMSIDILYEGV